MFYEILVRPILNILMVIYYGLNAVNFPYPLGFSIIALTIFVRLVMYPLITSQLRASKKMQAMTPHISRLKERHKGDAARIQQETMKLYKEHGVNPFAGCLPTLIQLPFIWGLYSVLQEIVSLKPEAVVAKINAAVYYPMFRLSEPWNQDFFGLSLGKNPSELFSYMPLIVLIPLLTALFQFIQSKMMFSPPIELVPEKLKSDLKKIESGKDPKSKEEDFASIFQAQSMYIFPFMIGFFSFTLPVGLSLYWNTFTIFGILQQYHVAGLGGVADWKDYIWTKSKKK